MDESIEEVDLSANNRALPSKPRLGPPYKQYQAPIRSSQSTHNSFQKGSSTQPHTPLFGRAAGRAPKRPRPSHASVEDDWVDIDSTTLNAKLPERRSPANTQPSTGFRRPIGLSKGPEVSLSSVTSQLQESTPTTSPTSTKRKHGEHNSILQTPSRSGSAWYGEANGTTMGRKRNLIATPSSSFRNGTSSLISDSPAPTFPELLQDSVDLIATLSGLASTITNMHKQYQKPMMDLARKVNALSDRLAEAEAQNASLRAHVEDTFESFAQQTSRRTRDLEEKCQEMIDAVGLQTVTRRPVPGGAYGGPANTLPNRQPSVFSGLLSSDRMSAQRR